MKKEFKIPPIGRRIVSGDSDPIRTPDLGLHVPTPIEVPEIENPVREKSRILKRLRVLVGEHEISAERVGIKLSHDD